MGKALLAAASTVVFAIGAEWLYRLAAPGPSRPFILDADRNPIGAGEVPFVDANPHVPAGRVRAMWQPNARFYICYEPASWDYFDEFGCVENRINSCRIREREELCGPKPAGQRRIVCVGDSFTFGWGVRVEDGWVRRVERELRAEDDGIRTVNCGASGTLFVDEYLESLRARFVDRDPDVVVVTLCLNDLIPSTNQLSHRHSLPWWLTKSRLTRDMLAGYATSLQFGWEPGTDPVREMLAWPDAVYGVVPWVASAGIGRADLWAGGGPQRALAAMQTWCEERGVGFGVTIWPYLQGLGPDTYYPFQTIHAEVAAFCASEAIPLHDVLPSLASVPAHELWVHPSDLHANARAHELAAPGIAAFCRSLLAGR